MSNYTHNEHAWTDEQGTHMHEKDWDSETEKPTGYQKALGAAAQMGYPGETNSTIKPYNQREHAWNADQHDVTHDKDWDAET